ncbi:MAG: alpha/beta fold hydrolase [Candidatus Omnitrophica bacterium]|nr:alpha/beta fold hydrolase [Candidatus Omnitrophota bacterium]
MTKSPSQKKGLIQWHRFRIPYRVYGNGEDVLCLNGAQQSMAMWFSFLQRFGQRYRITLFDFPHQGKAQILHGPSRISLEEQVAIVREVMRAAGIRQATVCSASWGGVVALLFALRFPALTQRLILASIGMKPNERMRRTIMQGVTMEKEERVSMAETLIASFGSCLSEKFKKQITRQFESMSAERLGEFCEHGLSVINAGALDKVVALHEVSVPTLVLYGENDPIIDFEDVELLALKIGGCGVYRIPGVGHFLHLEDEKVFDVYAAILSGGEVYHSSSRKICPLYF